MRKVSIAAAVLAVMSTVACQKEQGDTDLAKDLALAASSDGIAMAPSGAGRSTVSAIEQLPPGISHTLTSSRGAHSQAKHRAYRAKTSAPQVALLPSTTAIERASTNVDVWSAMTVTLGTV